MILLLVGNMVLPWIPVVLLLVVIQTVFVLGHRARCCRCATSTSATCSTSSAIVLQVLFYSAPIVYPITLRPEHGDGVAGSTIPLGDIYRLNPLVRFVECFRDVLYDLTLPAARDVVYIIAWSVAHAGDRHVRCSRKLDRRLAEEV